MATKNSIEKNDLDLDQKVSHLEGKAEVTEIGTFRVFGLDPGDADFFTNYPEEKRKKVFRKVRMPWSYASKTAQTDIRQRSMFASSLHWRSYI